MINKEEVKRIALLSRLDLSDDELCEMTTQLEKILAYIDELKEVSVENTEITSHVVQVGNIFRRDKPRPSLKKEDALCNAPKKEDGFFKVPKVIGE